MLEKFKNKLNVNVALIVLGSIALGSVIFFFVWFNTKSIEIFNAQGEENNSSGIKESPLSGVVCENSNTRPFAVMLASDPVARPLSSLNDADMVFEMPVNGAGITRMMAVYQCRQPSEIGSVRSAREDFIPLAAGLGAVYVHWGGERVALEKLDGGIINNIDAMKYEGTVFYRKKGTKPPHNGFTNFDNLRDIAGKLNYSLENNFTGYKHTTEKELPRSLSNLANIISIDYAKPYDVKWVYDSSKKMYLRSRGSQPEVDAITGQQVLAGVVVVMETTSHVLNRDYMNVKVVGGGPAKVYQGGIVVSGTWSKSAIDLSDKLIFKDIDDKEIEFLPGPIWVEVVSK